MVPGKILEAFRLAAANHMVDAEWKLAKERATIKNPWFTEKYIDQSLNQWLEALQADAVSAWRSQYPVKETDKVVGIIMAGNIPLVGMHDLFCCLEAGVKVRLKLSSDDEELPKYWIQKATEILPDLAERIEFSDSMKGVDAAIATGSNNSSRYFEYYFKNIPHVLRKNRNSVAVLSGNETEDDLQAVGHDVFDYYGLGCRNVTHLFLPESYAFKPLFDAWEHFVDHINHNKWVNNFHYHRALLLLNLDPHMDNGFILLKEKPEIYSPVGMLNYSFYSDLNQVLEKTNQAAGDIQCVCSNLPIEGAIPLGDSQKTTLFDYADGIDVMDWLTAL